MKLQITNITDKHAYGWCPFHKDKHKDGQPSLEITIEEGEYFGHYHCFGCNKTGTLTKLVMDQLLSKKKTGKMDIGANPIDWSELNSEYGNEYFWNQDKYGKPFEVSKTVLQILGCGWDGEAYTFPFRDDELNIIGIQRRFPDGFKCMVDGSRMGLIIPEICEDVSNIPIYICEGVSDTATVLDMGKFAIGRPNNDTGNELIQDWLLDNVSETAEPLPLCKNDLIYIIADNDKVGINGANKLAELLDLKGTHVLIPYEAKDIRELVSIKGKEWTINWLQECTKAND